MSTDHKPFPVYQLMDAFEAFTNGEPDVKPQHRSLYYFLVGYARKRGNVVRFNMPYELGMHGSGIGSWATYDAALKALATWGFIVYTPGANRFKVPVIELTFRNPTEDQLLTYWQSYCLSTANPTDDVQPILLVTLKRELEIERRRVEEVERLREEDKQRHAEETASLRSALAGLESENGKLKGEIDQWASELYGEPTREELKATISRLEANNAQASRTRGAPALVYPPWASDVFLAGWNEWLTYRQGKRDKLKPTSLQKMLDKLAAFDEGYCLQLFEKAITNGYTGLVFDDTALKFAQYLQAKQDPGYGTLPAAPPTHFAGNSFRQPRPAGRLNVEAAVAMSSAIAAGYSAATSPNGVAQSHDGGATGYRP